jgi:hypothetical protein
MLKLKSVRAARRCLLSTVLWLLVLIAADGTTRAEAQTRRIVGLGATTCQRFNADIGASTSGRREYLAWAQGYMSGILLSRPAGVDDGLDLNPASFNLLEQLKFLEDYCAGNVSMDFADAVEALYKRLRREDKT